MGSVNLFSVCVKVHSKMHILYIIISDQISCNRMNNFATEINILSVIYFFSIVLMFFLNIIFMLISLNTLLNKLQSTVLSLDLSCL